MTSNKEKYEKYRPKKFLGQNFLVDDNIGRKIIRALDIQKDNAVLEIGPGHGSLTKFLIEETEDLNVVEIDKSIIDELELKFGSSINIIHKDFLKLDLNEIVPGKKLNVIGNIPYNITTEILFKIFGCPGKITHAVIMMQKEVAQRLTAKRGTKDYGILAVQSQALSKPQLLFNVPRTAFFPKPRVESTVMKFILENTDHEIEDIQLFKELVRSSFSKRRKILSNSLKDFMEKYKLSKEDLNIDLSRRAEEISVEAYVKLSNDIKEMIED